SWGLDTGSVFRRTALRSWKMAVLAPMPNASVSTATVVKPGFFSSWRKANFRSFMAECFHGFNFGCSPGGDGARRERDDDKEQRDGKKSKRVGSADSKQEAAEHSHQDKSGNQSNGDPHRGHFKTFPDNQTHYIPALRANCHSDSDLAR